jgi:hypothetical protein
VSGNFGKAPRPIAGGAERLFVDLLLTQSIPQEKKPLLALVFGKQSAAWLTGALATTTNGSTQFMLCGMEGKPVFLPYSVKEDIAGDRQHRRLIRGDVIGASGCQRQILRHRHRMLAVRCRHH